MIVIDKHCTTVIYSLGKCGTTSFVNALDDNWYTSGEENIQWCNHIIDDSPTFMTQLDLLHSAVSEKNCSPVFIIRDPWERYVSGIKEIIQDHMSALMQPAEQSRTWVALMSDSNYLVEYLNRLFYLSEFTTNTQYRLENEFDWHRNFSINENYHTRNWLKTISKFPDARVINCTTLNDYIIELGFTPRTDNVSDDIDKDKVEYALMQCEVKHIIDKFITPEIERYKNLTR